MAVKNKVQYEDVVEYIKRNSCVNACTIIEEIRKIELAVSLHDDTCLLSCVPVRLVAFIEGFMRHQYVRIIDCNAKYRDNFFNLVKEVKYDNKIILSLERNVISFGQYASKLLSCNSLKDIIANINTLVGNTEYGQRIKTAEIDETLHNLFTKRHTFAHEIASQEGIKKEDVVNMIGASVTFIDITEQYVQSLVGIPVTAFDSQANMNEYAYSCFEKADNELTTVLNTINTNNPDVNWRNLQDSFYEFRKIAAMILCKDFEDGTIYNTIYNSELESITEGFSFYLRKKYGLLQEETE